MALNLDSVENAILDLMTDEVRIERLPRDSERTLDTNTGQFDEPARTVLYEGAALIGTNAQEPRPRDRGGVTMDDTLYYVRWPKSDDVRIRRDDRVIVTSCARDEQFVGVELRIEQEIHSSFSVSRRAHCTLVDYVVD